MSYTTADTVHRRDATGDAWVAFIDAMHSGRRVEIDEDMFDYWLGVLPPVWMNRHGVALSDGSVIPRASFGFAEGEENVTAFWCAGGRFFCCRTEEVNRPF